MKQLRRVRKPASIYQIESICFVEVVVPMVFDRDAFAKERAVGDARQVLGFLNWVRDIDNFARIVDGVTAFN